MMSSQQFRLRPIAPTDACDWNRTVAAYAAFPVISSGSTTSGSPGQKWKRAWLTDLTCRFIVLPSDDEASSSQSQPPRFPFDEDEEYYEESFHTWVWRALHAVQAVPAADEFVAYLRQNVSVVICEIGNDDSHHQQRLVVATERMTYGDLLTVHAPTCDDMNFVAECNVRDNLMPRLCLRFGNGLPFKRAVDVRAFFTPIVDGDFSASASYTYLRRALARSPAFLHVRVNVRKNGTINTASDGWTPAADDVILALFYDHKHQAGISSRDVVLVSRCGDQSMLRSMTKTKTKMEDTATGELVIVSRITDAVSRYARERLRSSSAMDHSHLAFPILNISGELNGFPMVLPSESLARVCDAHMAVRKWWTIAACDCKSRCDDDDEDDDVKTRVYDWLTHATSVLRRASDAKLHVVLYARQLNSHKYNSVMDAFKKSYQDDVNVRRLFNYPPKSFEKRYGNSEVVMFGKVYVPTEDRHKTVKVPLFALVEKETEKEQDRCSHVFVSLNVDALIPPMTDHVVVFNKNEHNNALQRACTASCFEDSESSTATEKAAWNLHAMQLGDAILLVLST